MPCNSEHMNATTKELELSRVACLLDELSGEALNRDHWSGYHPRVYCKGLDNKAADAMVSELCEKLQIADVSKLSLEIQIWWRDHQAADKARVKRELDNAKTEAERDAALAKLTPHERKVLGL